MAASGSALAQQPTEPSLTRSTAGGDARPWANGVSKQAQDRALELYLAGNAEFTESRFPQALVKYREAIRYWDHPAIQFNIAVSLINLDEPVEASQHLEKGLAHGAAPLGTSLYGQGLTYRKLLAAQLVRVRIVSVDLGAKISLDGKALLTGPGKAELVVLPGEHQVVATKVGFLTVSESFVLPAGKGKVYEIQPTLEPKPPAATSCAAANCTCYSPTVEIPQFTPKSEPAKSAARPLILSSPSPTPFRGPTVPLSPRASVPSSPMGGIQLANPAPSSGETTWEALVRAALTPTPPRPLTALDLPMPTPSTPVQLGTPILTPLVPTVPFTYQSPHDVALPVKTEFELLSQPTLAPQPTRFQLPLVPPVPPPPAYQPPMTTGYQPPMPAGYQPPTPTGYQPPTRRGINHR